MAVVAPEREGSGGRLAVGVVGNSDSNEERRSRDDLELILFQPNVEYLDKHIHTGVSKKTCNTDFTETGVGVCYALFWIALKSSDRGRKLLHISSFLIHCCF